MFNRNGRWFHRWVAIGLLIMVIAPACAYATTIQYQATNLPDTTLGQDLWQYHYQIDGSLDQFWSINILFNPSEYGALTGVSAGGGNWDTLLIDPDPFLPDNGYFNASVSSLIAQTSAQFDVSFVWLGSGTPGAQGFEVYDDFFNLVETGQTSLPSTVPEPGTLMIMVAGLLSLVMVRRARAST